MNNTPPRSALEERVRRLLTPPGFFVGLVAGFVACCVAGRKAPTLLPIEDFQRFHRFLNPEGLYYATALQVRALARRELPCDKIGVIIGGSSVMQGVGQRAHAAWTIRLQQELGDEFRVVNLAMRGGAPNEHGQIAAEMMCRDGRKIVHVCDVFLHTFADAPDGNRDVYRYFFHDARARGLLLPLPERDRTMAALAHERRDDARFDELRIQTRANRWLSFNDLWHVIGYEHAFTVWHPFARKHPWRARKAWREPPLNRKPFLKIREKGLVAVAQQGTPYDREDLERLRAQVLQSVPEVLRPRTLAVVNRLNPEFLQVVDQDTPGFLEGYDRKVQDALAYLRAAGLHAVEGCVSLQAADFLDYGHLVASGGNKLAVELAPHIRALADELGYLERKTARRKRD
ncbi:MAG: hypothetical protein L0Y71_05710 [Gemmataceae bacterium]|nr:hypothetical protein [Gemmataceae bacterium]